MARPVGAVIIGSGNIGTDLMIKMLKYPQNMELLAVVGIDPASEGLAMARARGLATTHEGIEGLKKLDCYSRHRHRLRCDLVPTPTRNMTPRCAPMASRSST